MYLFTTTDVSRHTIFPIEDLLWCSTKNCEENNMSTKTKFPEKKAWDAFVATTPKANKSICNIKALAGKSPVSIKSPNSIASRTRIQSLYAKGKKIENN